MKPSEGENHHDDGDNQVDQKDELAASWFSQPNGAGLKNSKDEGDEEHDDSDSNTIVVRVNVSVEYWGAKVFPVIGNDTEDDDGADLGGRDQQGNRRIDNPTVSATRVVKEMYFLTAALISTVVRGSGRDMDDNSGIKKWINY